MELMGGMENRIREKRKKKRGDRTKRDKKYDKEIEDRESNRER